MKPTAGLAVCVFFVAGSALAQTEGLRLHKGLTLQSREELQQTIGDDRQATAIVRHAIAAMATSLARSVKDPSQLRVLAAQVPAEWLPTVDGVTFTRLEWDA